MRQLLGIGLSITLAACDPAAGTGSGQGGGQVGGGGSGRPAPEDPPADGGAAPDGESVAIGDTDPPWPPDEPLPAEFDWPPWVTMPAPEQIVISWRTVESSTGAVHLGTTPDHGTTIASSTPSRQHQVDLGTLEPATAYYYEVEIDGTEARRRGVFVTPGMDRWRFMQFGEFHAATRSSYVAAFTPSIRDFRPHLLVDSGDMVNTGDSVTDWASYMRTSAPWISNVIILPAHSNHVNGPGGNAMLRGIFALPGNERWYPTRFGQVEFLTLDSTYGVNDDVDSVEPGWLAARTAEAHDGVDDPALLVASWHYPACSSNFAERAEARAWIMDNFVDTMLANGGVDLIVVGHDKYYERSLIDDSIVHLQTDIGELYPAEPGDNHPRCTPLVTDTATRSMAMFEADGDILNARVVDGDGAILDEFTVAR